MGGAGSLGPVQRWQTKYYASDSVTAATEGQVSLIATRWDYSNWVKHVVESNLPPDYMERIAEYVDSKFRKLSDPTRSEIEIAAFTALNIADELFQERESSSRSRETAKRAIEVVEKALSDSNSSLGCS